MASSIKPIDAASVHRINAGQVIVDLSSAVKELLENALDSGATAIDVRIKEHGLDSVEVSDNGSGVGEADWAGLGRKHHTSKLPDLAALPFVQTFGFRGEALSSLCALCGSVVVTTSTRETEPRGAVVKLGRDGAVVDSSGRVARPRGTTVTLTGLFESIPVRRKTFERTAKRDFPKLLSLLNAYALVPCCPAPTPASGSSSHEPRPAVRLRVEHITAGPGGKGLKRTTLLSTDGRGSLRAAVAAVWGPKALEGAQEISVDLEVEPDRMARLPLPSTPTPAAASDGADADHLAPGPVRVRLTGLISSSAWGMGRPSPDRQYIFLNSRPVDLKPAQRAMNEVYKSFNTHQYPLAVLDVSVPPESVDINVSPDKRTVMLHSEAKFLLAFRKALEEFWGKGRGEYAIGGASQNIRGLKGMLGKRQREGQEDIQEEAAEMGDGATDTGGPGQAEAGPEDGPDSEKAAPRVQSSSAILSNNDAQPEPSSRSTRSRITSATSAPSLVYEENTTVVSPVRGSRDRARDPSTSSLRGQSTPTRSTATNSARTRRLAEEYPVSPISVSSPTRASASASASALEVSPSASAGAGVKRVVDMLDTSRASWSPGRKRRFGVDQGGREGGETQEGSDGAAGTGESKGEPAAAAGKEGMRRFRERLKGFASRASEGVSSPESEEGGDGAAVNGAKEDQRANEIGSEAEADVGDAAAEDETAVSAQDSKRGTENSMRGHGRDLSGPIFIDEDTEDEVDARRSEEPLFIVDTDRPPVPGPSRTRSALVSTANNAEDASRQDLNRDSRAGYRSEFALPSVPPGTGAESVISFDMARLQARAARRRALLRPGPGTSKGVDDAFAKLRSGQAEAAAGVQNRDAAAAEAALSRVISKSDFARMEVLGQFNKGFIIARLRSGPQNQQDAPSELNGDGDHDAGTDDLFIIDQHASDEKYNFETLQRTTVIRSQRLLRPRPLFLTAGDELLAMEHAGVLRANGFEVVLDEEGAPGQGERVRLAAMPVSRGVSWEVGDLEGLLQVLGQGEGHGAGGGGGGGEGHTVRTPKARAMFASRACRKSVMIGKSLTKGQMKVLLEHMGEIDQPWNCPHGRPTMRHLVKLEQAGRRGRGTSGAGRIDWAKYAAERKERTSID